MLESYHITSSCLFLHAPVFLVLAQVFIRLDGLTCETTAESYLSGAGGTI